MFWMREDWEVDTEVIFIRCLSRFFDCLAHSNLSATLATDQKCPLSCRRISYLSLAESSAIYHRTDSLISTLVNGTLLNFGKRNEDDSLCPRPYKKGH